MRNCKHCGIDISSGSRNGLQCQTCRNGIGRYNLNRLDQIALHESQEGKCKLCDKEIDLFDRRKNNSAYIDHCHTTGRVRGILCHPCNISLGYIENNFTIEKLKQYLVP